MVGAGVGGQHQKVGGVAYVQSDHPLSWGTRRWSNRLLFEMGWKGRRKTSAGVPMKVGGAVRSPGLEHVKMCG